MISVILLATNYKPGTDKIRQDLSCSTTPVEVITIVRKSEIEKTMKRYPSERVIVSDVKGRGYACLEGIESAKGDVICFSPCRYYFTNELE